MKKLILALAYMFHCFAGAIGEENNSFALSLFSHLPKEENLVFSPYGIFSNLALLYFGAENDTAQEIQNTLHISGPKKKFLKAFHSHVTHLTKETENGYTFLVANALFPHKGTHFLTRFKEIATGDFDAKLQAVDFAIPENAIETINGWIEEKTRGKITSFISEKDIDSQTRLITANTVYFQGDWVFPFFIEEGIFHPTPDTQVKVEMLQKIQNFSHFENDHLQCLALPFMRSSTKHPFLECIILLPKKNTLFQLEQTLTVKKLEKILSSLEPTPINAHIPKFCFSEKYSLNAPLKDLGMKQSFTYRANFSKIDGMKDLFLNKVLHETYFAFNENGITATSATSCNLGITSTPPIVEDAKDFIADRPFLFFIIDYHSHAILFMGRMLHPERCHGN